MKLFSFLFLPIVLLFEGSFGVVEECGEEYHCSLSSQCIRKNPYVFSSVCFGRYYLIGRCCRNEDQSYEQNYDSEHVESRSNICGKRFHITPRISGGIDAKKDEFPWMVSLKAQHVLYYHSCAAFIISGRFALTSASCLLKNKGNEHGLILKLGEAHLNYHWLRNGYWIHEFHLHPKFNTTTLANDIALIHIHPHINMTLQVQPICLPEANKTYEGMIGTIVGWGPQNNRDGLSPALQKAQLRILTNSQCKLYNIFDKNSSQSFEYICVDPEGGARDSCNGDTGGPLMVQEQDGGWVAVGVIASGFGCSSHVEPTYTRISGYLGWIYEITGLSNL